MPSIFISGSGRRLGSILAIEFANKGWDIAIHYNSSEERANATAKEISSYGVKTIKVKADVRSESELKIAINEAYQSLGGIDVLVNNAGIFPAMKSLSELETDFWDNVMNTNLRSQFITSKLFSSIAKPGSRIVNIASLGAYQIWKGRMAYNVSKAGVLQLTRALARELAPNISVNVVCPGAIYMPSDPSIVDTSLISVEKVPMKRLGSALDVFDAVWFFATASTYITGQSLIVDGGYELTS